MEKQGFRFIILRALAHRLQNLADFMSRQTGEEERPVLREQTDFESTATGSVRDASRMVSSPESGMAGADGDNVPAHWLTQANAAEPPADWLARVQKAAPELLKQKGYSGRNAEGQSHTLPAAQADSHSQVIEAGTGQETPMAEALQPEEEIRRPAEPGTRVEDIQRRDATHRPASAHNIATHSQTLPSLPIVSNVPMTDAAMEQRIRLIEIVQAEKASGELAGQGKPEREESERQEYQTDVPASPDPGVKKHDVGRVRQEREHVGISKSNIGPTLAPTGEWPSQPVQPGSSPWQERLEIPANQQPEYNLWSQAGLSEPAYSSNRSPRVRVSETGKRVQAGMRWPSLPEEGTTDGKDGEMTWRAWERQRRLDEEQRGSPWNA